MGCVSQRSLVVDALRDKAFGVTERSEMIQHAFFGIEECICVRVVFLREFVLRYWYRQTEVC